jgi:dolichol-phosphate mannosyltransferase
MKTVIFLPTYNEKENIADLISEILKLGSDFSILVVDDSSDDGTAEILDKISQGNPKVIIVHRAGKRGRGISGREGFKRCLLENPDFIIEMDADFSHDPQAIPEFLREIQDCDVVVGSRFVKGSRVSGRPWFRDYLSTFAQFLSRVILGLKIKDATSGFRCFKRYVLESMDFDSFHAHGPAVVEELNYHIQKKWFKVKEIPILFRQRRLGRSKLNFSKLIAVFYTLIRVRLA